MLTVNISLDNSTDFVKVIQKDAVGCQYPQASTMRILLFHQIVHSYFGNDDNVILNELANQNLAPRQLIKKRAENKRTSIATSKTDSNEHFFKIPQAVNCKQRYQFSSTQIVTKSVSADSKQFSRQFDKFR